MIYKWDLHIDSLSPEVSRRAYLCLPEDYDEHPEKRYPVLYMFDGHNVFYDEDATYGTSWGMAQFMEESKTPVIIAAVECNSVGDGRMREYSPFTHTTEMGTFRGLGRSTMRWLIDEFKPMIDANARTLPDRENTLIAGSSMGGLMSLYAALEYNDVFSRAACLSPSLWISPSKVHRMIKNASVAPDTLIYMDYGTEEIGNHPQNPDVLIDACSALLRKSVNLTFRIVPGASHCEAAWRQRVPLFMQCLGI